MKKQTQLYPGGTRQILRLALLVVILGTLPAVAHAQTAPGITAISWNADGTLLAVGRANGSVDIVNRLGNPLRALTITEGITARPLIAWHPVDPAVLAVNVFQGPIQIFDLSANSTLEIAGRENVRKLAWSPDGTQLASVGDSEGLIQTESALELWDPATGAMVTAYTDGYLFTDCAWNPANNGQILLAGLMNFEGVEFVLWDSQTQSVTWRVQEAYGATRVAWSPTGSHIVTATYTPIAGEDHALVALRDAATGEVVGAELPTALLRISNATWAPSDYLALANLRQIELWAPGTGPGTPTLIMSLETAASAFAWSPDGTQLAYVTEIGAIERVTIFDTPHDNRASTPSSQRQTMAEPYDVRWSPDSTLLAVAGREGVRIYDAALQEVAHLAGHTSAVLSVSWSPDGLHLASAGDTGDATLRIWDFDPLTQTFSLQRVLPTQYDWLSVAVWSPDGASLAVLGKNAPPGTLEPFGTVDIWDTATWEIAQSLPGPLSPALNMLAWNDDGTKLAGGGSVTESMQNCDLCPHSYAPFFYIADVQTGEIEQVFGWYDVDGALVWDHGARLTTLAGPTLMMTYDTIGEPIAPIFENEVEVECGFKDISLSPDGHAMALSNVVSACIVDTTTGQILDKYFVTGEDIVALDWSPDGRTLAVAERNGQISVHDVSAFAAGPADR